MEALRGNATFNKINKAANREMRMLHILEEKIGLKHPKSNEIKHLNVQFCVKMNWSVSEMAVCISCWVTRTALGMSISALVQVHVV